MITLIAAVAQNNVIGKNNKLPWHLPADLQYFKKMTLGKPLLMGRKTYESIGKPLKNRTNFILSTTLREPPEGFQILRSVPEVLRKFKGEELFVIGGQEIYSQFLPFANRLLLTKIQSTFEGNVIFPYFSPDQWELVSFIQGPLDEKNKLPHAYCVYERVGPFAFNTQENI